jgi:hypothetical protein
MGPGLLGTGTKYGFSGIEQGYIIDSINTLGGFPVFIPRISFQDKRIRHFGISHHSLTILDQVAKTRANVVFPILDVSKQIILEKQTQNMGIDDKHAIFYVDGSGVFEAISTYNITVSTMNRGLEDDREFFMTCGSAAMFVKNRLSKNR